jgi:hypothetical protein
VIPVTLVFETAGDVVVDVVVDLDRAAEGHMQHGDMEHGAEGHGAMDHGSGGHGHGGHGDASD